MQLCSFFTRKSYEKQKRACRGNQAKMAKAKPYILAKTDISIGLCLGASPSYNTRKTSLSHIPAATVYLDRLIIHPEMKAQGTQSNSQEWYYVLCPPVLHCYHTMVWHAYGLPSNHLSAGMQTCLSCNIIKCLFLALWRYYCFLFLNVV